LYPERQEDGRILKQLHLGFPVFYEGSEGDTIRLLKQNTVETVVLMSREDT
jgi:site-specific DNA recombinase